MMNVAIERLAVLCDIIPPLLHGIDEATFAAKPMPDKWSKKQILGHLIDSATINHHRMVRAQFQDVPCIVYDQDAWNYYGYYQQINAGQLIALWVAYNRQLLALIPHIPADLLSRTVDTGDPDKKHSVAFLVTDYVTHLEHHLRQIVSY